MVMIYLHEKELFQNMIGSPRHELHLRRHELHLHCQNQLNRIKIYSHKINNHMAFLFIIPISTGPIDHVRNFNDF